MTLNDIQSRAQGPDLNEAVLRGRLATDPECRTYSSGATMARLLLAVRSESPRPRTDVIPVTVWEPAPSVVEAVRGTALYVVGQVHRRFWTDSEGRQSRIELVATTVEVADPPPAADD